MIAASASERARRAADALSHGGAASAPVASHRLATETTQRKTRRRMGYWTIFTFSRAAACVT